MSIKIEAILEPREHKKEEVIRIRRHWNRGRELIVLIVNDSEYILSTSELEQAIRAVTQ